MSETSIARYEQNKKKDGPSCPIIPFDKKKKIFKKIPPTNQSKSHAGRSNTESLLPLHCRGTYCNNNNHRTDFGLKSIGIVNN